MLARLLPVYDYTKADYDSVFPLSSSGKNTEFESENVWLHPTALNNTFFTKALQDFSDNQNKQEVYSRARNRSGLRSNITNRYNYRSLTESTFQNKDKSQSTKVPNGVYDDQVSFFYCLISIFC